MEQPPLPIDELQIAEAVTKGISRVRGSDVPFGDKAILATVGPGARVWGVAVHRLAGALNIDVELVATLKKQGSLPILAARVRRMVRQAVQSITTEQVRRVNIRITDVRIEE